MIRHTDWMKARVERVNGLQQKTFVSAAPEGTELPYAILHPRDGDDDTESLTGPSVHMHPSCVLLVVHRDAEAAARLAEDVKDQFIVHGFGVVPEIEGELPSAVTYSVPTSIGVEKKTTPWEYFHTSEIGFATQTL